MISPLFSDNTFEFIPIKEPSIHISENIPTYQQIKAFNSEKKLAFYLPVKVQNYYAHNDPEFDTFTYGDLTSKSRSSNLRNIQKGDYLFFLARLTPFKENVYTKSEGGFYLIDYLLVEGIHSTEEEINENKHKIKNNVHYFRYKNKTEKIGEFFIIKGDLKKSKRFLRPIVVDRTFCDKFLLDAQGNPLSWGGKFKTENQAIGSYTRVIRAFLDSEKIEAFLDYTKTKNK